MDAMRALLTQIGDAEESLLAGRSSAAASLQAQTRWVLLGGGALTMLLAAMIAMWLARNISRPLRSAVGVARRVAAGDLGARIDVRSTTRAEN